MIDLLINFFDFNCGLVSSMSTARSLIAFAVIDGIVVHLSRIDAKQLGLVLQAPLYAL